MNEQKRTNDSECWHKRIRCTDNVFYCCDCGAMIEKPEPVKRPARKKGAAK